MDGERLSKREWSRWWLLIPVALLLVQISALPYLEPDSVPYLSMATSLIEKGEMLKCGKPHWTYAPGYPAVLGGAMLFGFDRFLTSSVLNAALGLIYLLGVWRWTRSVAPSCSVWLTCLSVGHVVVLYLFRRPLSEPLFMSLLVWSSICLDRVVRQLPGRIDWLSLGMGTLLTGMLCATRHVGIFVVAGLGTWLLMLWWKQSVNWKQMICVTAVPGVMALSVVMALILHDQHTKQYAPKNSNWDMLLRKSNFAAEHMEETVTGHIIEGIRIRIYEIGRLLIPGMFGCHAKTGQWLNVNTFIFVPIAAVTFFGWWRLARRHSNTLVMMFPWYFALYVYWPSDQGGRFFAPILPLLFLSLWKGMSLWPALRNRWVPVVLVISHACVGLGLWVFTDLRINGSNSHRRGEMTTFSQKLMEETGQVGTFETGNWPSMYLAHLLDRAIVQYDPAQPPAHLLWPVDRELPPGYVEAAAGKQYRLARLAGTP